MGIRRIAKLARRFGCDTGGSVAIYAAVALTVLFCGCGVAIDMARGFLLKSRLSSAVDAAALAGGAVLPDTTRCDAVTRAYFAANIEGDAMGASIVTPTIVYSNGDTEITVSTSATLQTTLMRLVGFETLTVTATATATESSLIGSASTAAN